MSEFNVIQQFFTRPTRHTDMGIGDDAALITLSKGSQLAISADMLVAGTHFFHDADPEKLGWKSLAVNVSDMAAMSAQAKWATLAIALPRIDERWLGAFSQGFFACADTYNIDLIGGDTTRGPLTISVQIMGEAPKDSALKRSHAKVEDDIWVSGSIGAAALGLAHLQSKVTLTPDTLDACLRALHSPTPRASLGIALRGIANSCIDISDGLLADLNHILKASNLGAQIDLSDIPCHHDLKNNLDDTLIQSCILAGGDDYELLFTAQASQREALHQLSRTLKLPLTCIGKTTASLELNVIYKSRHLLITKQGFDHFGE